MTREAYKKLILQKKAQTMAPGAPMGQEQKSLADPHSTEAPEQPQAMDKNALEGTEYEGLIKKGPETSDIFKLIMEHCPQLGDTTFHNANTTSKVWAMADQLAKTIEKGVAQIMGVTNPTARAKVNYRKIIALQLPRDEELLMPSEDLTKRRHRKLDEEEATYQDLVYEPHQKRTERERKRIERNANNKHDTQHLTVIKQLDKLKHEVIEHAISDTDDPKVKEKARKESYMKTIIKKAQQYDPEMHARTMRDHEKYKKEQDDEKKDQEMINAMELGDVQRMQHLAQFCSPKDQGIVAEVIRRHATDKSRKPIEYLKDIMRERMDDEDRAIEEDREYPA